MRARLSAVSMRLARNQVDMRSSYTADERSDDQNFARSSNAFKPSVAVPARKVELSAPADVPTSTWNGNAPSSWEGCRLSIAAIARKTPT